MSIIEPPVIGHILCGVDGSDPACRAARHASRLAVALNAKLTFLAVAQKGKPDAALENYKRAEGLGDEPVPLMTAAAEACLTAARSVALSLGHETPKPIIRVGKVAPTFLSVAKEIAADTVILGRHEHNDIYSYITGSVSRTIASQSRLNLHLVW